MSISDKLKKFQEKLDLSKTFKGVYKFDKRIFRIAIILMVFVFVAGWGLDGFVNPTQYNIYVNCPAEGGKPCHNPFFQQCDTPICPEPPELDTRIDYQGQLDALPTLPPGFSYGKKPNWIIRNGWLIAIFILMLSFIVNHRVHNKHIKFWHGVKKNLMEAKE